MSSGNDAAKLAESSSSVGGAAASKAKPAPRPVPPYLKPLQFMGIPRGVLTWKPRLPSRNWSIFLGVTISLTSLYVYDRRECKRIKQEYIDQLSHLAKDPLKPNEYPRKVTVYTAKSPNDDDYEKSLLFFKMYVKPFLVAAAIDFTTTNGTRHGGLAREIRERQYSRRRQLAGLEPWGTPPSTSSDQIIDPAIAGLTPFALSPQQQLQSELDGGVIVVGRPAYKEWAWGLREGWTTKLPSKRQDLDELLGQELSEDGAFDEIEDEKDAKARDGFVNSSITISEDGEEPDGAGAPLPSKLNSIGGQSPMSFNPAFNQARLANTNNSSKSSKKESDDDLNVDQRLLEPPSEIPAQPPLTFVDYINLTGFRHVPRKIVGFFRHRDRFELGGQAAMNVALGNKVDAREYDAPLNMEGQLTCTSPPQGGDLDWGLNAERFYLPKFDKTLKDVESAKATYYTELKRRLQDTRSYVRGERQLTASEKNDPPKSEGDLREERFKREKEWRLLTLGYEIIRPNEGLAWHPAFIGKLRVFQHQDKRPIENQKSKENGEEL